MCHGHSLVRISKFESRELCLEHGLALLGLHHDQRMYHLAASHACASAGTCARACVRACGGMCFSGDDGCFLFRIGSHSAIPAARSRSPVADGLAGGRNGAVGLQSPSPSGIEWKGGRGSTRQLWMLMRDETISGIDEPL